ncbi:MAG: serine protease [Candidatus Eisenbacteria bacterium]|uniref:Serine protease n=1 Tax=Eiseniibacteriota bacterium TaxID=2212470 RepID=A0A933SFJ4_UNCEI|nr:serine protease [Candidatus Eisenbacteria bacterium]
MLPLFFQRHRAEARTDRETGRPRFGVFGIVLLALVCAFAAGGPLQRDARAQSAVTAVEVDVDALVKRARPSMLTVVAQRTVTTRSRTAGQGPARRTHSRIGSGVAVGADEILTTASVVLGSNKVFVITDNGLQVEAVVVGMDPIRNIALVRAPRLQLSPVRFASRAPQLGDWVVTLGSSYRAQPTQSVGHVSSRYREPRTSLLQLTNEVFPGNSGGAALNTRGELVGLVQGELGAPEAPGRRGADSERRPSGMSFVIPSEDIVPVHRSLKAEGRVRLGYFGVSTRGAFVESESEPGVRIPIGAIVEGTQAGGPAEKLGLRKGDLIVAYDGERVEYPEQLARWVAATPPGTVVSLVWARNDMQRSGRVAVGESRETIPSWMRVEGDEAPVASGAAGAGTARIKGIEDEIRRLNRELGRLRSTQDSVR